MGSIVEHAPAETAGMFSPRSGIVQNPQMPQRLLLPFFPGIEGFRREHVAVVLCDHQRFLLIGHHGFFALAAGIPAGVGEIIVGVNIFQQTALFKIPDTGNGSAGIRLPGHRICQFIEFVIVPAFVDPDTPENDTGVVTVLAHHFSGIFHRLVFPGFPADVLPTGNFCKHQQAQSVAFINKMVALRIMGGTYRHAIQFFLQDPGSLPLKTLRRRIAHVRKTLMPVQSPQEGLLAIEIEAVFFEFRCPEAHFHFLDIQHLADL